LRFNARNIGDERFSFSTALHSYLLVEDIASVEIDGLRHGEFQDQLHPEKRRGIQNEALLKCGDKLDRIYHRVPADLTVRSAGRRLSLHQAGFSDAVVWNPGAEAAAALSDLGDHEYRQFICVEAAQIERIHLPPGQEWVGYHRMRA
jgi:glucose-6-phosphate 1-epimerase